MRPPLLFLHAPPPPLLLLRARNHPCSSSPRPQPPLLLLRLAVLLVPAPCRREDVAQPLAPPQTWLTAGRRCGLGSPRWRERERRRRTRLRVSDSDSAEVPTPSSSSGSGVARRNPPRCWPGEAARLPRCRLRWWWPPRCRMTQRGEGTTHFFVVRCLRPKMGDVFAYLVEG